MDLTSVRTTPNIRRGFWGHCRLSGERAAIQLFRYLAACYQYGHDHRHLLAEQIERFDGLFGEADNLARRRH
jgi:hypothetical protein